MLPTAPSNVEANPGERPRERLLARGPGALTDIELLALMLGNGVAGDSALALARRALEWAGGAAALLGAAADDLRRLRGFGPARAARLVATREFVRRGLLEETARRDVLGSPAAVRDYLQLTLAALPHEAFLALFLDSQNRVLAARELFRGTLAQTSVYPREVVKAALAENAAGVIFAHNHPSGVAEPSRADELLTASLKSALALVDIRTLDHFVVAGHRVVSFAERGLL
ncbi:MAG: DNA repair protein RadC [Burkholderiales bacterium]|nr:DNA repair protein RadC [Burkholderiales bacterium]